MKHALLTNWRTSLIGLVFIAAGLYSGITAKQSWTESMMVIGAGTGFIFTKDAINPPQK